MSLAVRLLVLTAALCVAGCHTVSAARVRLGLAPDPAVERGRATAEQRCGGCHAVDGEAASPNAKASPFRQIRRRYNEIAFARELEAIRAVGHYQMPAVVLSDQEARDVGAYVRSLGPR